MYCDDPIKLYNFNYLQIHMPIKVFYIAFQALLPASRGNVAVMCLMLPNNRPVGCTMHIRISKPYPGHGIL